MGFSFFNAHDLNTAYDDSQEVSIKQQLRERLKNTSVFIVLIGESTRYLYKFVRWEMEQAIKMNLPIIAVNINGLKTMDTDRCPPIIKDTLAIHISFNASILQYALENWPTKHKEYFEKSDMRSYFYTLETYQKLGL